MKVNTVHRFALIIIAVLLFGFIRGGLDYWVCMLFMPQDIYHIWAVWCPFLTYSGLLIPLFFRNYRYTILGGVGVCLAENMFYVWVNLFGNLNNCYDWYTGNPLNPDGAWGYGWTNPLNMQEFFIQSIGNYVMLAILITVIIYLIKNRKQLSAVWKTIKPKTYI